jgi:glucose-6-phosphate dehydrogenase assembly protein OpcA
VSTLWDTTGSDVVKALSSERRSAGALAFGLALTLVVVTDQQSVEEAEAAATAAAAAHPCRLLMVIRRHVEAPDPRLDAEVLIGGRLGPGEAVVMRMYGRLALHAESVTLPLLAPDAPVVTWWHDAPPEKIAYDPLGVFADRRITDVARCADPMAALEQRANDYAPGDTDLAWTRTTNWRSLIAAAFDSVTGRPTSAVVSGPRTPPSALLVGWLRSRLGIDVTLNEARGKEISSVTLKLDDGREVKLERADNRSATLSLPDQGQRTQPLASRDLGDLLAEEVRRLDDDEVYAESLGAWTGIEGLSKQSPFRTHIWRDPAQEKAAEPDPPESPHGSTTPPADAPAAGSDQSSGNSSSPGEAEQSDEQPAEAGADQG